MQRFFIRAIAGITLLAALALFQQQIHAQSSAGAPAGQQMSIYLPLLMAAGTTNPVPTPPPPVGAGFFTLTDYLTYNVATAIDSQGVVHLAFYASDERHGDAPLGQPAFYTSCAAGAAACGDSDKWNGLVQIDSAVNEVQIAVTSDGRPRFVTRATVSGLPDRVVYFACDQGCDDPSGWASTTLQHPEGRQWANWDLALDSAGRPRIALYDAPAPDIFVGGKLYYGWCEASCADMDAPFQIVQVAGGEGMNVDLAIDAQGRTHLVYDAGQRGTLGEVWCDTNCTSAGAWQRRILETSDQLMQEFAPASPFTCDQQERAWFDAIPSVAFSPTGQLVVAYDIKIVATCYYTDPTDPSKPPSTRVERIWWGVRWSTIGRG